MTDPTPTRDEAVRSYPNWPEYLMIRDTGLHDDNGGIGQRIYTTAGAGYKKVRYVREDLATAPAPAIGVDAGRVTLFSALEAAYIRGAAWCAEMGMTHTFAELRKAAYDYADKEEKDVICRDASAPAPASGRVDAVAIKPLQWEAKTGGCTATGLGINYAMGEQDPGMFCLFHPFHTEQMPQAQIQAIAQADYEQRIRSVIYSAAVIHGPCGYLTIPLGLGEEHWRLSDEPDNDADHVSLPMFTKEDPFAYLPEGRASLSPAATPVSEAGGEAPTCYNTGLRCLAGCDGRTCAGANVPLNQWPEPALVKPPAGEEAGGEPFQQRVQPWMMACFGAEISADVVERNHRFLEEALELVQSTGCTASEAHQLVDYVFGRAVGETRQEVGGVMVTLAALCLALGEDMHAAGETELARIWTKVEKIRAKQAAKPKHSPLPQALAKPASSPAGGDVAHALKTLMKAIQRAEDGAGTLPAKEAVKLRPADWHAVCDRARKLAALSQSTSAGRG